MTYQSKSHVAGWVAVLACARSTFEHASGSKGFAGDSERVARFTLNSRRGSRRRCRWWWCFRTSNANKAATLMDGCQLLTFLSYISRLSDTKVPFTQSFTLAELCSDTHRQINHSYSVTVILRVPNETWRRRRRTCSCWFYWWWWKTGINSLLISRVMDGTKTKINN